MTKSTIESPPLAVVHNAAAARFEATVDGLLCVAAYRRSPGAVDFHHTGVPQALEGRGIAAALVKAALSWAQTEGLKAQASCSYVRVYMQRHPQTLVQRN